jgi:acyl-CoA dehydrogenase
MDSPQAAGFAELIEAVRKVAAEVASAHAPDVDAKARFPIETLAALRRPP